MKKLVVVLSIVLLAIACKKEKCSDTYTISGRIFTGNYENPYDDTPLKNTLVEFSSMTSKKSIFSKDEMINLGSVYTDDYGYFSISYKCITIDAHVEMEISSNSQYVPGISYVLPKNQDIHRDFTQTSHARIVCEIENETDMDTLFLTGAFIELADTGDVKYLKDKKMMIVPVKNQKQTRFVFTAGLANDLVKGRGFSVNYGKSYEDMDAKNYLGREYISCQGAPYYDTVRIELK